MERRRFSEQQAAGERRRAPAASRNVGPIGDVLAGWLPEAGLVLEVASGTGEHGVAFARRFPGIIWQPSDVDESALQSIAAWQRHENLRNLRPPLKIDVQDSDWPITRADVLFSANMVHISPWQSALGLLDGAQRVLQPFGSLILYGPWIVEGVETAPSNLSFDSDLRRRNPQWGLRKVSDLSTEAAARGLVLREMRAMPANNVMLRLQCIERLSPTSNG